MFQRKELRFADKRGDLYPLQVVAAPEPDDIKWENLEDEATERTVRMLISTSITVLILVASFVFSLSSSKNDRHVPSVRCAGCWLPGKQTYALLYSKRKVSCLVFGTQLREGMQIRVCVASFAPSRGCDASKRTRASVAALAASSHGRRTCVGVCVASFALSRGCDAS